jgi:hypothetical protein
MREASHAYGLALRRRCRCLHKRRGRMRTAHFSDARPPRIGRGRAPTPPRRLPRARLPGPRRRLLKPERWQKSCDFGLEQRPILAASMLHSDRLAHPPPVRQAKRNVIYVKGILAHCTSYRRLPSGLMIDQKFKPFSLSILRARQKAVTASSS